MHSSIKAPYILWAILLLFSCKSTQKANTTTEKPLPENFIANELIIQLQSSDFDAFATQFNSYGLSLKKVLAKRLNLFLVTYDTATVTPRKMLEMVRNAPGVTAAEFNKRSTIRDN